MKRPDEVKLSREEGDALIERVKANTLTEADRQVLVKLIRLWFWLSVALSEAKLSIGRLKRALFGRGRDGGDDDQGEGPSGNPAESSPPQPSPSATGTGKGQGGRSSSSKPRRGHGRQSAQAYSGAQVVSCRHEALAVGQLCPACGRGRLYELAAGVELRVDGQALLSAIRYELEKLRCSGCGEIFTAPLPESAGEQKYSARARAVLAVGRYYLGLPFYRMEAFQAMVGVPVADATQWDLVERVADSAYPVFDQLVYLAAQGELIYQDDTHARVLTLIRENRRQATSDADTDAESRSGMYTTGLVVEVEGRRIILYLTGRAHAGDNLAAVLDQREPGRAKPLVMSDALAANHLADESILIRCYCLAHGVRKFTDIDSAFPEECQRVLADLSLVFEHDAVTRKEAMTAQERLQYHQTHSGPLLEDLKAWLEKQVAERNVEPNTSLGKAFAYLLVRWESLTRFLSVPNAPLDSNTVERALKLAIRQRRNSLFYATEHGAYVASVLTSLIATCVEAGVNALDYLVALQQNRSAVFQAPAAWLPWTYRQTLACA